MDQTQLARRLGLFDATMIVMGGIIGSGIFMNPSVVALQVHTPFLILGAWAVGGLFAMTAAFIWAELAALRPDVGGQYAYLRDGRGCSYVRALLCRTDKCVDLIRVSRGHSARDADCDQLSGRAGGQHRAEHPDGVEDCGDRDAGRVRISVRTPKHKSIGTIR